MPIYSSLDPAGLIKPMGTSGAVGNQLICDGSAVLRASYPRLFAAIGTNFGIGDGSTTFNLPDIRGTFPRGQNLGSGNDPDAASRTNPNSGATGDAVGSYQGHDFLSHVHGILLHGNPGIGGVGAFLTAVTSTTTNAAGGNETRPINVYTLYVITY